MVRNNLVALTIHGFLGTLVFLFGEVYWQQLRVLHLVFGLIVLYAGYFAAAFLAAKLRLFNRNKKKVRHVLLPGIALLFSLALLVLTDFSFYSEFFGLLVGVFGQPIELLLAVSGSRLDTLAALLAALAECAIPVALIWLGLRAGGRTRVDGLRGA